MSAPTRRARSSLSIATAGPPAPPAPNEQPIVQARPDNDAIDGNAHVGEPEPRPPPASSERLEVDVAGAECHLGRPAPRPIEAAVMADEARGQ